MRRRAATGLLVLAAVATAAPAVATRRSAVTPPCYGAAARDPRHQPCRNRALRFAVEPTPGAAQITPNEPCTRTIATTMVHPCLFGAAPADADARIALIGDSHASHWRAALAPVATAEHWTGASITRSVCAISTAVKLLPPAGRAECARWHREVLDWLVAHPDVSIVFQAQIASRIGVVTRRGQSVFAAEVEGFRRFWHQLPASVRHVVVIRDNPVSPASTPGCVMRASAARRPPGRACAVSRKERLRRDPAAVAAARSRSRRVQLVDMTHFYCGARLCWPVIGGALVYKDTTHLTRAYVRTMAPFLLRRVRHLMTGWRP